MNSLGGITVIMGFIISGVFAFFALSKLEDGNVRIFSIGSLTVGLFIGFSILWTVLGIYLMHRYANSPSITVHFWGIEAGIAIASVLCGFVFTRPSAEPTPPHLTQIDRRWMTSPRRAFYTGLLIALLTPSGLATIIFIMVAIYGLCTGDNLFKWK